MSLNFARISPTFHQISPEFRSNFTNFRKISPKIVKFRNNSPTHRTILPTFRKSAKPHKTPRLCSGMKVRTCPGSTKNSRFWRHSTSTQHLVPRCLQFRKFSPTFANFSLNFANIFRISQHFAKFRQNFAKLR